MSTVFFLRDYLLIPLAVTIIAAATLICKDYIQRRKGKINTVNFKRHISFCAFLLYYLILLQSTVFSRLKQPVENPLTNVLGGWIITGGKYFYDLSVIWNVIIFLPFCLFFYFLLKEVLKKETENRKLFKYSVLFSICTTVLIEILQIILHAGTFQFADLFYNTLGGVLGSLLFVFIKSRIVKMKLNKHKKSSD